MTADKEHWLYSSALFFNAALAGSNFGENWTLFSINIACCLFLAVVFPIREPQ